MDKIANEIYKELINDIHTNIDDQDEANNITDKLEKLVNQLAMPKIADNANGFLYELEKKFLELKEMRCGNNWAESYDEYIAVTSLRNFYLTKIQNGN